jgi:peptidoglycan/LPS O-acetylase OafA/YrhL
LVVRLISGKPVDLRPLASELVFLQSYVPGIWDHTWSLAVEEHFYLLLPIVLTVMLRSNRSSPTPLAPVLRLAGGVAISALFLRLLNWY